jgi:hypothetical protein
MLHNNALIENFATSNNKKCVGLHVSASSCTGTKKINFLKAFTHDLAKPIVMTEKTWNHFSVSISSAINHLINHVELIDFEAVSLKYCVCVSFPQLPCMQIT